MSKTTATTTLQSHYQNDIKSQAEKILAIDTMRGYVIDSEDEEIREIMKLENFICGENSTILEKFAAYFYYLKGKCSKVYDCMVICCTDQHLSIEREIKTLCSKIFNNVEIYIIGSRAPLFTHWFSQLGQKPNFGELTAISRIKYAEPNKPGMVCGIFTRSRNENGEFLAQIDGVTTSKNDFNELKSKILEKLPTYFSTPTTNFNNIKINFVAVYPDKYAFEDISKPKMIGLKHFSHKETDRAKGALLFGKNKVNEDGLEEYIEIEEHQNPAVKIMQIPFSPPPASSSLRSTTTTQSTNIQNTENGLQQFLHELKHIVAIDIGTTFCRAAVIYKDENGKEKCEKVSLKGINDKMPSMVTFGENQTYKGCEAEAKINNDATISEGNTVFDIINFMGKNLNEVYQHPFLPFKVERNRDFVKIMLKIGPILPEVACGELLKFIVHEIDEKLKDTVTYVTLTTPIFNDQNAKSRFETALKCAAQLASLNVLTFVDSPTAALIDYIFKHKKSTSGNYNICVIDIGAATDIVGYNVETYVEGFSLEPLFKFGDSKFGGRSFDIALAEKIKQIFQGKHDHEVNIGSNFALLTRAEKMKQMLSSNSNANYSYEKESATVTTKDLEQCIHPLMEGFKEKLKEIKTKLEENGKKSEILLVGSTCKIPIINKTIKNIFSNSKNIDAIFYDDDISFAQGAALHTAKFEKSNDNKSVYKY